MRGYGDTMREYADEVRMQRDEAVRNLAASEGASEAEKAQLRQEIIDAQARLEQANAEIARRDAENEARNQAADEAIARADNVLRQRPPTGGDRTTLDCAELKAGIKKVQKIVNDITANIAAIQTIVTNFRPDTVPPPPAPTSANIDGLLDDVTKKLAEFFKAQKELLSARKKEAMKTAEYTCLQITIEAANELKGKIKKIVTGKCDLLTDIQNVTDEVTELVDSRNQALLMARAAAEPRFASGVKTSFTDGNFDWEEKIPDARGATKRTIRGQSLNGDMESRITVLKNQLAATQRAPTIDNLEELLTLSGQYKNDNGIFKDTLDFIFKTKDLRRLDYGGARRILPRIKKVGGARGNLRHNPSAFPINPPASSDFKKLAVKTNNNCSGLHIGNYDTPGKPPYGIVLTAGHCIKNALEPDTSTDPRNVTYIHDRFDKANVVGILNLGYLPTKQSYDSAILYVDKQKDTSNVYILTNPEDLDEGTELIAFGVISRPEWRGGITIGKEDTPEFKTLLESLLPIEDVPNYRNILRGICDNPNLRQGDSGGPIGIQSGDRFIYVGNVVSETGDECTWLINASNYLTLLEEKGISVNTVTYNKTSHEFTVINRGAPGSTIRPPTPAPAPTPTPAQTLASVQEVSVETDRTGTPGSTLRPPDAAQTDNAETPPLTPFTDDEGDNQTPPNTLMSFLGRVLATPPPSRPPGILQPPSQPPSQPPAQPPPPPPYTEPGLPYEPVELLKGEIRFKASRLARDQILRLMRFVVGREEALNIAQQLNGTADRNQQKVLDIKLRLQLNLSDTNDLATALQGAVDFFEKENAKLKTCISTRKAAATQEYDKDLAEVEKRRKEVLAKTFEVKKPDEQKQNPYANRTDIDGLERELKSKEEAAERLKGDEKQKKNRDNLLNQARQIRERLNVLRGQNTESTGGRKRRMVTMRRKRF